MAGFFEKLRAVFFVLVVLGMLALCSVYLMKIQIVDGDSYLQKSKSTSKAKQTISSPRGEIVDADGKEAVSNKVGFNVVIEKAFAPRDKQELNRIILSIAEILIEDDVEWIDNLPITDTKPYDFLPSREGDIAKLRTNINVQPYATADDCLLAMAELYDISDSYTREEQRIIAGVRYEMVIRSFSISNRYTFAEDIPMDTVIKLKEASFSLDGMDIIEEAIRVYSAGDTAPHLIGTIGSINAEEYETLKEKGYAINDTLGKSGVEKAMEDELRGVNGTRTLELLDGAVVSDTITEEATPGNSVQLTFSLDYQSKVEDILANHIYWLRHQTSSKAKGMDGNGGAIVVTDVKTGAILAAATNPSYSIDDYLENYSAVLNGENKPLVNRATSGLYRPGSTFKTVTATAALNYGLIDPNTTVSCNGQYSYWEDYKPKCTGYHGRINVVTALEKSCNIFFYDVGRQMGIDRLANYATYYGFGQNTGIEIGDYSGVFATPDSLAARKLEWQAGLIVQIAIGQSETGVTPLQMAMQASTIANRGVRYKPYIVDSIHTYNMEETISETKPTIAFTIPDETGYTFDTVIKGMEQAANFVEYTYPAVKDYYTDYLLTGLPEQAAIKTGTPQMTTAEDTGSAFIGFYPADDPQIAFSGFVEHGEYSKFMIRQIIDAYYNKNYRVVPPTERVTEAAKTEILSGLDTAPSEALPSTAVTTAVPETTREQTETAGQAPAAQTQTSALTENEPPDSDTTVIQED